MRRNGHSESRRRQDEVLDFSCAVLFVPIAGLVGRPIEMWALDASRGFTLGIDTLHSANYITSVWGVLLATHAAFAAIAPILGYTLLTSAAAPLSRFAPAGFVVAEVIQWRSYLLESIGLLTGSLLAMFAIPSVTGCVAALLSVWYVIFLTYRVFKEGFQLLQNEPQFDQQARAYLQKAIVEVQKPALAPEIERRRVVFSEWLAQLPPFDWSLNRRYFVVVIGIRDKPSELLTMRSGAAKRLESIAAQQGLVLRSSDFSQLPSSLPAGSHTLLVAVPAAPEAGPARDAPPDQESESALDEDFTLLQQTLEELIQFGEGLWVEQQQRIPMLVLGHLAVTLNEALNRRVPHELKFALQALGELIDLVTARDLDGAMLGSEPYRWVYDIPASLTRRVTADNFGDQTYEIALVVFIRARLRMWLKDARNDVLARAYLDLLVEIVVGVIAAGRRVDDLLIYVREITAMVGARSGRAVRMVSRAVLLAFLDTRIAANHFGQARKRLIRTLHDAVTFSNLGSEKSGREIQLEVAIHSVAVALFLADREQEFRPHVGELLQSRLMDLNHDGEMTLTLFQIAQDTEAQIDSWRWDWWELDVKGSDDAHFMSMSYWLLRSTGLFLAQSPWSISNIPDSSLPPLDVLGRIRRAVAEPGWHELLAGESVGDIPGLLRALDAAIERRERIVQAAIDAAPIDEGKSLQFVESVVDDLGKSYSPFSRWLQSVGMVTLVAEPKVTAQAGVTQLLKRDLFVADDYLDIASVVLPPSVGTSLVSFEIRKIATTAMESEANVVDIPSADDSRAWDFVNSLLGAGAAVLVVGYGVGVHQVWRSVESARAIAEQSGAPFRYEGFRSPEFKGVPSIVVIARGGVLINRFLLEDDNAGIARWLDLADGDVPPLSVAGLFGVRG